MTFLDTVAQARTALEKQQRLSQRALRREFSPDAETLADLVDELVNVLRIATLDGEVLVWSGGEVSAAANATNAAPRRPRAAPASYTPKHLADKILQSQSALEGERKQVTVLFADVKGSMELAEQVDPEEWHRILDRFFAILTDGVHRFEGTVNQYTGDGIMALFGAPIAHEDHAQRACYSALRISDELRPTPTSCDREHGLDFSVRIGINSGEVVVGKIGDDLRMDYTAQGHTVGLAARMEQLAEPGNAYLTEHTAPLVAGFFQLRDLGEFTLEGRCASPLRVHELEGTGRTSVHALDVSHARGSLQVRRPPERDGRSRGGSRAGSLGATRRSSAWSPRAGTGKSRMCYEFAERCRAREIPVYEGHGVAYGKAIPLLPVLEFQRSYFGITEHDTARVARDKIAGPDAPARPEARRGTGGHVRISRRAGSRASLLSRF